MFKINFLILFFIHILCDFYFQTDKMAVKKNEDIKILLLHCIIYAVISFTAVILLFKNSLTAALLVSTGHFVVDVLKFMCIKNNVIIKKKTMYITDQLIHIAFLTAGAYILRCETPVINSIDIGIEAAFAVKILVLAALMHKPANITIKRFIEEYRPIKNTVESNNSTGAFIGTIERYIILILLYLGQYSATGLVLTAKSIARYHEMEDKEFAEYYLIGTLLSMLIVIIAYLIILK